MRVRSGRNQHKPRKIGPYPRRVTGQQTMTGDRRVGADEEIRKRRGALSSAAAIAQKGLAGEERRLEGYRLTQECIARQPRVELLDRGETDGNFGENDRIDDERRRIGGFGERG